MKRRKCFTNLSYMGALLGATMLTACGSGEGRPAGDGSDFVPETVAVYEAEDGSFSGNAGVGSSRGGYSGSGYATGFEADGDSISITVNSPEEGFYDLVFFCASSDHKENFVTVDGLGYNNLVSESSTFTECPIERVYLKEGAHEVIVSKSWGYMDIDRLELRTCDADMGGTFRPVVKPVNPNASDNVRRLMSYLADIYGKQTLSGQFCDTGWHGKEFTVVNKVTGKNPAVLGLDFIEYSPSRVANGSTSRATDFAIDFWKNGGIVNFCWHWNAPEKYLKDPWYSGFYTQYTTIDLKKIMNGEDAEGYELLMEDIDAIAQQLLILQENDVPVIWRPLHEASGGWFWWGASGPEAYKQLYILLYDKLTNEYGLNNLIWLWNGQSAAWYPGDQYVDIIGWDIYPGEHEYGSQIGTFLKSVECAENETKMVVLSENGCVPDPELMLRDGAMWGYWCTWGGEFVAGNTAVYVYSDQYTESEALAKFYENDIVITLDELPDLKTYPIREDAK
ncbi:MAG: beta-mannosidase [Lachnospiraceae bacterium]|nr:beta-mannosidase [Lachnospiraceae bacterium]